MSDALERKYSDIIGGRKVEKRMGYKVLRVLPFPVGIVDREYAIAGHYIYFKDLNIEPDINFGIKIDTIDNDLIVPKEGEFIEVPYGFQKIFVTLGLSFADNAYVDIFIGSNLHYGEIPKYQPLNDPIQQWVTAANVVIGLAATAIPPAVNYVDIWNKTIILKNNDTETVYVGGVGVTVAAGFPIHEGESISFDLTSPEADILVPPRLYGIVNAGAGDIRYIWGA